MNKSEIIGKLEVYVEQLQQNLEMVKFSEGRISKADIERTLQTARSVHEWVMLLHYFNSQIPPSRSADIVEPPAPNFEPIPTVPSPVMESTPKPTLPPAASQTYVEEPVILPKPAAEPIPEPTPIPTPAEVAPIIQAQQEIEIPTPLPTPEIPVSEQSEIITPAVASPAAKPSPEVFVSLNDRKSETVTERLADRLQFSKIDDLKKAIPLHEKFQFINELFKGENIPYNEFITLLNTATNQSEAFKICDQYANRFKWDRETKTFIKLQELIQRRFA